MTLSWNWSKQHLFNQEGRPTEAASFIRDRLHRLSGIPTHVVVPSVSLAAVLHGLAGTVLVPTPSSAGTDKPVREEGGEGATWPAGGAPVLPPMTPPEVGGLSAGVVGAACF